MLAAVACNGSSAHQPAPAVATPTVVDAAPPLTQDAMDQPALFVLRASADIAAHLNTVVEAHGTYAVLSTGRQKILYTRADGSTGSTNKVVRLELDGGAVDLWVRPDDEIAALTGKRVVVTGKLIPPTAAAPAAAAPDARPSLVDISGVAAE